MVWQARENLLTFEEIERVARLMVERYGVDSIRLTGGEPTLRARLPLLVAKLAPLEVDLSMTTNASTMPLLAHDLTLHQAAAFDVADRRLTDLSSPVDTTKLSRLRSCPTSASPTSILRVGLVWST